ncbi:MAG: hypothetical protein ACOYYS_18475 [Chloroflexota bacterium]
MITPEKIDEWIQEAEARPWSAAMLIRHVANRLNEVTQWNEELQAENIALRSEKKVEDFERQIAALEYQLDLLKRQLGGEAVLDLPAPLPRAETLDLLLYTPQGRVLRFTMDVERLESGLVLAELAAGDPSVRMLVASSTEELLFAFDTGRVVTMPVGDIPLAAAEGQPFPPAGPMQADWEKAYMQLPIGSEELVHLLPIARLPLYDSIVQVSRKACVKKIKESLFKGYLTRLYIGSGVKANVDRMFALAMCQPDDAVVLISKEGFMTRLAVADLPITIEESLRLGITDHLVAAFAVGEKPSLLVVTNNGKAIHREQGWLQSGPLKSKGYAAFSEARRRAGIQVVGAAAVAEDDWGLALLADGRVVCLRIANLMAHGALLPGEEPVQVVSFTAW